MNEVRWYIAIPLAVVASFASYECARRIIEAILPLQSGSLFASIPGMVVDCVGMAAPIVIFIMTGVLVSPSSGRKVCFAFYFLSQFFSAPVIRFVIFGGGLGFLLVIIGGGLIGLWIALWVQNRRAEQAVAPSRP
jgi:hypothetical protein